MDQLKELAPLILLIIAVASLIITGIIKLVKYHRAHACDWAARRLAKCVPANQCAQKPMYVQAKRCPVVAYGANHAKRPIFQYAQAPMQSDPPQCIPNPNHMVTVPPANATCNVMQTPPANATCNVMQTPPPQQTCAVKKIIRTVDNTQNYDGSY